jgi:hypothetical protein
MKRSTARLLVGVYFVVMALAVVWPGAVPASRIDPMILGLPFSFAWPALWVAVSVPVLWGLDRVEGRHRESGPAMPQPPGLEVDDDEGGA